MRADRINPPADQIGRDNVVFTGTARRHYVPPVAGSFSIKTTVRGTAHWHTVSSRYSVAEDRWLLLGDGEEYSLTIDSVEPVTTFCLFFRRGLVEDALRCAVTRSEVLLDEPFASVTPVLATGLRPYPQPLSNALSSLYQSHRTETSASSWDEFFVRAGEALTHALLGETIRTLDLATAKAATRAELQRRVQCGLDFMLSNLDRPLTTEVIAREAGLSTFHFHRSFRAIHRKAPHQFLTEQRLRRASLLLQSTPLTVAEIALRVGFESLAAFSTLFRRRLGLSPGQYRSANPLR